MPQDFATDRATGKPTCDIHALVGDVYGCYRQQLVALADSHLNPRLRIRLDAEDIVQSVFRTFYRRAKNDQFRIMNTNSLWCLLVQITLNKLYKQVKFHHAGKRDIDVEVRSRDVAPRNQSSDPAEITALRSEIEFLTCRSPGKETEILQLCLQGYLIPEIADQVGCSRWTVRRILDRFGAQLEQRLQPEA